MAEVCMEILSILNALLSRYRRFQGYIHFSTNQKVDENGYYNAAHPEEGTITIQDNMCGDGRINTIPTDTDVLVIYASANDITANAQIGELDDQDETH